MILDKFRSNAYSQYGEDGVIKKILEIDGMDKGWCIDIGAWDGIKFSNIRSLFLRGFKCVFVEADERRATQLRHNYFDHDNAFVVGQMVFPNRLNSIIGRYQQKIGLQKAVFNIDIDGDHALYLSKIAWDWKIIVAEWNNRGDTSQLEPLLNLAEERGYKCVCKTNSNLILVPNELAEKIEKAL